MRNPTSFSWMPRTQAVLTCWSFAYSAIIFVSLSWGNVEVVTNIYCILRTEGKVQKVQKIFLWKAEWWKIITQHLLDRCIHFLQNWMQIASHSLEDSGSFFITKFSACIFLHLEDRVLTRFRSLVLQFVQFYFCSWVMELFRLVWGRAQNYSFREETLLFSSVWKLWPALHSEKQERCNPRLSSRMSVKNNCCVGCWLEVTCKSYYITFST